MIKIDNNITEENNNKFYTCRYDRPFKELMLRESNRDILKLILEFILKVKIMDIKVNSIENLSGNIHLRKKYFDILLTTNIGILEVEVNAKIKNYIHVRNMAFISDVYSHSTLIGTKYDTEKKYIQINFSYGLEDEKGIRVYYMQDESGKQFVNNLIIYEVNMDYYMKLWYDKNEEQIQKNKYIIMMDLNPNDLKELSRKDKVVHRYMDDLVELNKDPEFRQYMSAEEDDIKLKNSIRYDGIQEGIKEGIQEGINQRNIELAKNMLQEGLDISLISRITDLSKEEIEKLNI